MKKASKVLSLFFVITYLLLLYGDISPLARAEHKLKTKLENLQCEQDSLNVKIEENNDSLEYLYCTFAKQSDDSIVKYDIASKNAVALTKNSKQITRLQIKIAKTAELAWSEYWQQNFPKYKQFLDSKFTKRDIKLLSNYIGTAGFSLTNCPEVDYNYVRNLDDIIYGPYWEYIADYIQKENPALATRYTNIRTLAQKKYPYIFANNVFYLSYFEPTITKTIGIDSITKYDRAFSDAVQIGSDSLSIWAYDKHRKPQKYMNDFNRLRNIPGNNFTTNLHYFIESIFYDADQECIDINCPVFASHYTELLDFTEQLRILLDKQERLNKQKKRDHKNIADKFDKARIKTKLKLECENKELEQQCKNLKQKSRFVKRQLKSLYGRDR